MSGAVGAVPRPAHPIGRRVPRVDGVAKVTGRARYAADVPLPGALWGVVLRSPLPHARLVAVDVSRARALPGVHAVLTARDLPPAHLGRSLSDVPLLAREVVRFIGDRVAAVAAEDLEVARQALELIEVRYEELPAVFTPSESLRPDAPVLHPDFPSYRGAPAEPLPHPNLCAYERLTKGEPERGFATADLVLEHAYRTPMQHQGYLEPHTCVVACEADGTARVWASNKAPFLLRDELARVLDLPPERVVVEPTWVGGDFGGKGSAMHLPLAYWLSRASGRPVRMLLDAAEEFLAANPRHAAELTVRTGVTRDGRMLARSVSVVFDGGAYAGFKPMPTANLAGRYWSAGPYAIPGVAWESAIAYTNHLPGGHMRAPGGAQAMFAVEVDADVVAHALGMDPLEFRLRNAVGEGDEGPLGERWRSARLRECLAAVRDALAWGSPKPPDIGRGVAVAQCDGGLGGSSAVVEVHAGGRVVLRTGVSDQGSGSHTLLVQIVAAELQVPLERVELVVGSTADAPWDSGSSASRVTYVAGLAALRAASQARERLCALAAEYLGCAEDRVELSDGVCRERERPENGLALDELARRAIPPERPVVGEHRFVDFHMADTPSFAAVGVEVGVDRETGQVSVRRAVGAFDVGTVLNEIGATGQLEGGLIQGFGAAVMEELRLADGRVETLSLADYRLPTIADVPPLQARLITEAPGNGPYGAKAIGELANQLLPPAIANAVFDAVGVRITELPVTAEKVYRALRA